MGMAKAPSRESGPPALFDRVQGIIDSARAAAARSVNTAQVVVNWLIGREIIEEEQKGADRAGYRERLMRDLADRLGKAYGFGYSLPNLKLFKQFYLAYRGLVDARKGYSASSLLRPASAAHDPGLNMDGRLSRHCLDN